jgi:hypothetical protein
MDQLFKAARHLGPAPRREPTLLQSRTQSEWLRDRQDCS